MKKLWPLLILMLLFSCSDDKKSSSEEIPVAPSFLQKMSHDIAEEVEELRGISRTEGHTLRIDTAAYYEESDESAYFGLLYEPMKQSGFFPPIERRSTLPRHWRERYDFWDGEVGGYFTSSSPDDIHLVLPSNNETYLNTLLTDNPSNLKTIAHEYTHLLQNQQGLLSIFDSAMYFNQLSRALLITEGDATFTMDIWGSLYTTGAVDLDSVITFEEGEILLYEYYLAYNKLNDRIAFLIGHYIYGPLQVAKTFSEGGAEAVNQLFADKSVSISEIITGNKQQTPTLHINSMQVLFPTGSEIIADNIGPYLLSILCNRHFFGSEFKKVEHFRKQYGIVSDEYYTAQSGGHFQTLWHMRFSNWDYAQVVETIFQQINAKENGTSRPTLTFTSEFTEGEFFVKHYEGANFSSYIVTKEMDLWVIDNPHMKIGNLLEHL